MLEEPRHHIMNKQAFQACLAAWRNGDWPNGVISANVHATAALKSFPSPDSTLFDEQNKRVIAFEFKPPTETKRGMLTSIGQAFAYLNSANAAFVISPKTVEGYAIGDYLSDTFKHHIVGRAPVGLLIYEDDDPSNIHIAIDIDPATIIEKKIDRNEISNRYWAKHVDMSWDAMFDLMDIAYTLPITTPNRYRAVWIEFWKRFTCDGKIAKTLRLMESPYGWRPNKKLSILTKKKKKARKEVLAARKNGQDWRSLLKLCLKQFEADISTTVIGDNQCNSYQKNFMTFLKHLQIMDDSAILLSDGISLHRAGKIYGVNSNIYMTQLKKIVLLNGKHLDVILDLDEFCQGHLPPTQEQALSEFIADYEQKGLIKRNPGRERGGGNEQFRYEMILWRKLGLLDKGFSAGRFKFNWREIARVISD